MHAPMTAALAMVLAAGGMTMVANPRAPSADDHDGQSITALAFTADGGVASPSMMLTPQAALGICSASQKGIILSLTSDGHIYECDGSTWRQLLRYLHGSASLDFANTAAGADDTLTLTVTGAATTDEVHCSARASLGAGMTLSQVWVSSANTVSITIGNLKLLAATNPAATTFDCTIIGP